MKQYILLILICLIFLPVASFGSEDHKNSKDSQMADNNQQTYFYYYKGNKKYLKLNPNYIFVSGTKTNSIQSANLNTRINIQHVSEVKEDITSQTLHKPNNFSVKHPVRYWAEIELGRKYSEKDYFTQIETLKSNTNLIVAPYFEDKTGEKIGLSNYFYVKLKESTDFEVLLQQIEKYNVELVGYNKFMPLWFTLSVTPQSRNALQMANLFYETGLFQHAEPDLMVDVQLNNAESSPENTSTSFDPYYPYQWHLNNTGQNGGIVGIDINAEAAWNITTGDYNTTIAVLDDGIEIYHPDLAANSASWGYDTETGTSPSQVYGSHGTACGGIVAGVGNNGLGISGVAPNGGLISVSLNFLNTINYSQRFANGIYWSVLYADVEIISNSWRTIPSVLVDDAIDYALINGRGGLGTVVVFAPDILSVGAMSPCGERKSQNSCDGVYWPCGGSGYGNELDIVAPGVFIPTTDRQGNNGYNNTDYKLDFDGTSAACPIVAGVAALVLSVNSNLTVYEVNDIIEQSAQKVRSDLYAYQYVGGRPNGTWNSEMGYGLVDAYQAVLLAQSGNGSDCPPAWNLPQVNISGIYQAQYTVTSTATINLNWPVIFKAGDYISLEPGFWANGSNSYYFHATIENCSNNFNTPTNNLAQEPTDVSYGYEDKQTEIAKQMTVDASIPFAIKNYPNPFTGQTTIEYNLPNDSPVMLVVTDFTGKQIAVLVNGEQKPKGIHTVSFDGSNYPTGMYYYTIQAGEYVETQKMILMK